VKRKIRRRMKVIIANWFLLGIGVFVAWGQRPPAHTAGAIAISSHEQPHRETSSITFLTSEDGAPVHSLGPDQGVLSLGRISYFLEPDVDGVEIQRQKSSFVVSSRFDVRVDFSHGHRKDTATVSACLLSPTAVGTVWLDDIQLSMTPRIIGRRVSYGAITEHVLKIVVPGSMPAGQLVDLIGVIVTPN
jgi:hypothetical protein